jgi:hemolysin activation/secretion protein
MLLPGKGYYIHVSLKAYGGISNYAKSFGQLSSAFSVYLPIDKRNSIVLADRLGGAITVGKNAFYQSVFIGGHENLLGYRQYRFAGEHALYNNLEARAKLANFTGYIVPGELGLLAFYDAGRVWVDDEQSATWHQGIGGGLYFAPAKLAVLSVVAGHSSEGWYPYITLGFRF